MSFVVYSTTNNSFDFGFEYSGVGVRVHDDNFTVFKFFSKDGQVVAEYEVELNIYVKSADEALDEIQNEYYVNKGSFTTY